MSSQRLGKEATLPKRPWRARQMRSCRSTTMARNGRGRQSGCSVRFSVTKRVQFGSFVRVVGAVRGLGNWEELQGLDLEWSDGDIWTGELCMLDWPPGGVVEYKYVIMCGDKVQWQEGRNRVIHLFNLECVEDESSLEVRDTWVHERDQCVQFLETALDSSPLSELEPEPACTDRRRDDSREAVIQKEPEPFCERREQTEPTEEPCAHLPSKEDTDEALLQQAAAISALEAERELLLDRLKLHDRELRAKDAVVGALQAELRVAARARSTLAQQLVEARASGQSPWPGIGDWVNPASRLHLSSTGANSFSMQRASKLRGASHMPGERRRLAPLSRLENGRTDHELGNWKTSAQSGGVEENA